MQIFLSTYIVALASFCFYGYEPQFGNVFSYWLGSLLFPDRKYLLCLAVAVAASLIHQLIKWIRRRLRSTVGGECEA